MHEFSLEEIASLASAKLYGPPELRIKQFNIDSRQSNKGGLFVARRGWQDDGHNYLEEACAQEPSALMLEEAWVASHPDSFTEFQARNLSILLVNDSDRALFQWAKNYRLAKANLHIIAITGSYGKTSCKELLAAILASKYEVFRSPGNHNASIGVVQALLSIENEQFAVVELGIDRKGEMDELVEMVRPDSAIITAIGSSHLELLESLEGVAYEKRKIFKFLSPKGRALIPELGPLGEILKENIAAEQLIIFKHEFRDFNLESVRDLGLDGLEFELAGHKIHFSALGFSQLSNFLAASCMARYFACSATEISRAVNKYQPLFGRGQVLRGKNIDIVQDCYNANLESSSALVDWAWALRGKIREDQRVVLLFADILELGNYTKAVHRELGRQLLSQTPELLLLYGAEVRYIYDILMEELRHSSKILWSTSKDELKNHITRYLAPGDIVILKGSRSMHLEELTKFIFALSFNK